MALVIPNEECYIAFEEDASDSKVWAGGDLTTPNLADVYGGSEVDLTCFLSSLNATAQGNTVPAPVLCSLFETTVPGTSSAQFSGEFYRDGTSDDAWDTLPRKTKGYFYIIRFGVTYSGGAPVPAVGDVVEVWPVEVTSRAAGPMASGTPLSFTVTCAVNVVPNEGFTLAA